MAKISYLLCIKRRCNFVIRNNFKKEFVIKQLNELKVKLGI